MNPFLKVDNLSISYSGDSVQATTIVKSISFELYPGKTLALVGQSGSGKTLTAYSLLGLLPEGDFFVGGKVYLESKSGENKDLLSLPKTALKKIRGKEIGFVFQDPTSALNPVYTIGEQLAEAVKQTRKVSFSAAREIAKDLLKEVSFKLPENIFNAYPHELSGGEKQRVMIATSIAGEPRVLIADEPTASLDASSQSDIIRLLHDLQLKHNLSVLLISHDLKLVEDIADDVLVMHQGEIIEKGQTQNILAHPRHPFTKGLIACKPSPDKRNLKLPLMEDFFEQSAIKKITDFDGSTSIIYSERETVNKISRETPLINIQHLSVTYSRERGLFSGNSDSIRALDNVSLNIFRGEILGLCGESGSGKSTLGRAILQLVKPISGEIFFNNISLTKLKANELRMKRKDFQIVFQNPLASLNPLRSIGESILEPLKIHHPKASANEISGIALDALLKVGLHEKIWHRLPHELSGGELQRVCIARAISLKPAFMVFDEPVSSLDLGAQAQIINLIQELRSSINLTVLFISHDLNLLRYLADRIVVLEKGSLTENVIIE